MQPLVRAFQTSRVTIYNHSLECCDLLDALTTTILNRVGKFPRKWVEADTILFRYQGSPDVRADTSRLVERVIRKFGGKDYVHVTAREGVELLWSDRKSAIPGVLQTFPGSIGYIAEVW